MLPTSSPGWNLTERPRLRLFALCALYAAQGIPWGFVAITLTAWLAQQGLTVEQVGRVLALSTLPWAFKWAWGPVLDRFGASAMGRRRPWIVLAQLLMALTMGALIAVDDLVGQIELLGWIVFLHNVFNALQDVAVDALAVDLLPEDQRGRANGLMYGSKYLGGAIGGAGLGTVIAWTDLRTGLTFQAGALLVVMLLPLLVRERPGERLFPWSEGRLMAPTDLAAKTTLVGLFTDLARAFSLRSTLLAGLLAVGIQIGIGTLGAVRTVLFISELGWSDTEISQITGGPALVLGLLGSIAGGWLADKVGHRRLAAIATVTLGVWWLGFAAARPLWTSRELITAVMIGEPLITSVLSVSLFALFMGVSWPRVAATQFTAYMALLNLSTTIGSGVAGPAQEALGSPAAVWVAAGVLQIAMVGILPLIDPHQARRTLGGEIGSPSGA